MYAGRGARTIFVNTVCAVPRLKHSRRGFTHGVSRAARRISGSRQPPRSDRDRAGVAGGKEEEVGASARVTMDSGPFGRLDSAAKTRARSKKQDPGAGWERQEDTESPIESNAIVPRAGPRRPFGDFESAIAKHAPFDIPLSAEAMVRQEMTKRPSPRGGGDARGNSSPANKKGTEPSTNSQGMKRASGPPVNAHTAKERFLRGEPPTDASVPLSQDTLFRRQTYSPSEQIYVLGTDLRARFIAYSIAAEPTLPPVRLLLHNQELWQKWHDGGQRIWLLEGNDITYQDRIVAEFASRNEKPPKGAELSNEHIDFLIVTVPSFVAVAAIEPIKHRLDRWSTLCFVQDGLGIAEAILDAFFPNESERPVIILGHMSHQLGYHTNMQFALALIKPGKLYLTVRRPGKEYDRMVQYGLVGVKYHPPFQRVSRAIYLMRLLKAVAKLQSEGKDWEVWLQYKMPTLVFRAIADPISTVLDVPYDAIPKNASASRLLDHMLGEVCAVIQQIPETKDWAAWQRYCRDGRFRTKIFDALNRHRFLASMQSRIRKGWHSDGDFLLGYLIRRGREVGVRVTSLEVMLWLTRAKHQQALHDRRRDIPSETEYELPQIEWLIDPKAPLTDGEARWPPREAEAEAEPRSAPWSVDGGGGGDGGGEEQSDYHYHYEVPFEEADPGGSGQADGNY